MATLPFTDYCLTVWRPVLTASVNEGRCSAKFRSALKVWRRVDESAKSNHATRAFSSEVDTGSREENASKQ